MRPGPQVVVAGVALVLVVVMVLAVARIGILIHITPGGGSGQTQTAHVGVLAGGSAPSSSPLFPGATGDVTIRVMNPSGRPVTVTGLVLSPPGRFAPGFSGPAMAEARPGCDAGNSGVTWGGASAPGNTDNALTSPVVVSARSSLVVTLTDAASMELTAPRSCEGAYFAMPSPAGITAFAGGGDPTRSPVTDSLAPRCPPPPPGFPPGPPPGPPTRTPPRPGAPGPWTPPPPGPAGCAPSPSGSNPIGP